MDSNSFMCAGDVCVIWAKTGCSTLELRIFSPFLDAIASKDVIECPFNLLQLISRKFKIFDTRFRNQNIVLIFPCAAHEGDRKLWLYLESYAVPHNRKQIFQNRQPHYSAAHFHFVENLRFIRNFPFVAPFATPFLTCFAFFSIYSSTFQIMFVRFIWASLTPRQICAEFLIVLLFLICVRARYQLFVPPLFHWV